MRTSDIVLVLFAFLLSFALNRVDANLFVILLQGSQILTGLGELSLFHTLSDVPVDEGTLGIHQIELVIETGPSFGNGGRVAQHADGTLHLSKISARYNGRWLVVDAHLEASRTPADELDGALCLDGGYSGIDVLRDNITTVQHAAGHVLAVTRITLHHLVGWLEAGVGDLSHRQLLVVSLLGRYDWCVGGQWEMDTWVGHQVGLELGQIDVEGTVKAQRCRNGADNLADQTIQVGVCGTLDVQVATADVVNGFVVDHEGAVGVLKGSMGRQNRVVRLNDGSGHLWGRVDSELEL